MNRRDDFSWWALIVLIVVSVGTMIAFDRPLIRGDGVAYAAWLDTFVRDRDIDLANQYERFQPVNTYQITWDVELGRYVNIFPFGVAIVQAPAYVAGALLTQTGIADQNPGYFLAMQGINQGYSVAIMVGANLMMLIAMALTWRLTVPLAGNWTAAFLVWVFFCCTPLLYYTSILPLNSHNPGAFLIAVLVFLVITFIRPLSPAPEDASRSVPWWVWIIIGTSAGMLVLVRWQLAVVVALAWLLMAAERRHWRGLAAATVIAVIVMLPLPVIWNEMFGKPFVVPYNETTGQSFFRLPVNAHRVFWHMITTSPIVLLSLAGIPFLWRIDRRWTALGVAAIVAEILINGSTRDWYAGDSFGSRRMSELYTIYVLLAAALAGKLRPVPGWWRQTRPVVARALTVLLLAYSVLFLAAFMVFTWTNPEYRFSDDPDVMIRYFFDHPDPMGVIDVIFETHLGPYAWDKPGP